MQQKKIIIIAGPNGAGKTTFAREFLPHEAGCPIFVNADLIASGFAPFQPEVAAIKAGRMMLQEIAMHAERGDNFAFETTLAGRGYFRMIRTWREQGYLVKLFFLSLAILSVINNCASQPDSLALKADLLDRTSHLVAALRIVLRKLWQESLREYPKVAITCRRMSSADVSFPGCEILKRSTGLKLICGTGTIIVVMHPS